MPTHIPVQDNHAIDDRHPVDYIEPKEQERSEQSEIIMSILFWMLRHDTTAKTQVPAHMGARVWVLSVALGVESISWAEIGRRCGLTREGVRLMAKELESEFGLRAVNARTEPTRRASRRARERFIKAKGNKQC